MVKKLSYNDFLKSFEHAPRIAINLFITNKNGEILLTKRAKEPYKDYWHVPGSFLLKDEEISSCIKRILKDELGFTKKNSKAEFMFVSEDLEGDPRGHVIDLLYKISVEPYSISSVNDMKEIKFFQKLPLNIGFNHREVINKLGYK